MNTQSFTPFGIALLRWYDQNARRLPWREGTGPYAIWISEVMLQQTQVKTVLLYYDRFLNTFPNVDSLARAPLQDVLKQWEGLGYYARARNLHRAARMIVAEHNGTIPADRRQFQKLPGVGDYISAAVLSIAFNQPYPVVDGNVKRVLARLFQMSAPVNKPAAFKQFHAKAAELLDPQRPGDFNQAMMEIGALVCKPAHPACTTCPLSFACRSFERQTVADYPRKLKTKPTPSVHMAIGIVLRKDRILITKRPTDGLLGGLWEFPGGELKPNETPAAACVRAIKQTVNLTVTVKAFLTQVAHAYTHFKIKADVFICSYQKGSPALKRAVDYRWIGLDEIDQYPFPKANHKFFDVLRSSFADYAAPQTINR